MTQTIATLHYIMTFPHKSASFKFVTLIYKTEEKNFRLKIHRLDGGALHQHPFPPRPLPSPWKTPCQRSDQKKVLPHNDYYNCQRSKEGAVSQFSLKSFSILALIRFELFREIREMCQAVIEEHEETLDESDPRHYH